MGWTGIWQWVVVLAIVLLLFGGRGKISALMGDFGKGLRSFKTGLKEEDSVEAKGEDAQSIEEKAESKSAEEDKSSSS
ncbi:MAG: twin-arginine translocase TatA/TatE family subunit [Rhodospirillaceae bacterium]|nr:twin-arginine translocase TatA/TatE family subunit [Rhodospirillaceae bacterium]